MSLIDEPGPCPQGRGPFPAVGRAVQRGVNKTCFSTASPPRPHSPAGEFAQRIGRGKERAELGVARLAGWQGLRRAVQSRLPGRVILVGGVGLAQELSAKDALAAHVREELGLSEVHSANPLQAAAASGLTFTVAAAVPLAAAVLAPAGFVIPVVVVATLVALAGLGAVGAHAGGHRRAAPPPACYSGGPPPWRSRRASAIFSGSTSEGHMPPASPVSRCDPGRQGSRCVPRTRGHRTRPDGT